MVTTNTIQVLHEPGTWDAPKGVQTHAPEHTSCCLGMDTAGVRLLGASWVERTQKPLDGTMQQFWRGFKGKRQHTS